MVAEYARVCAIDDIPNGTVKAFTIGEHSILIANRDGEFHAIANTCSHDGGDLGDGKLVDGQVECPRHGARFDIKTGEAVRMPAVVGVDRYDVKAEDGTILVELEED